MVIEVGMKKLSILIIFLTLLSSIVHGDEYPYTQRYSDDRNPTWPDHLQASRDAQKTNDLDALRKLCGEYRTTYTEVEELRRYLMLFSDTHSSMTNITRKQGQFDMFLALQEEALQHVGDVLGNMEVPPEILPQYWVLRMSSVKSRYPDPTLPLGAVTFGSGRSVGFGRSSRSVRPIPDTPLNKAGEIRRREITLCSIELLGLLERAMDPRWDPKHRPVVPLPHVPREQLTISGGTNATYLPDYIKDPVLKQKYINALAKQRRAQSWSSAQRDLRDHQQRSGLRVEEQLVFFYAQAPDNLPELKQILADNKISPEATHRILSAVAIARGEPAP